LETFPNRQVGSRRDRFGLGRFGLRFNRLLVEGGVVDKNVLGKRKLITESLKDYTRTAILGEFASLDEFLQHWTTEEQKQAVVPNSNSKAFSSTNSRSKSAKTSTPSIWSVTSLRELESALYAAAG
jgi:type I site-specific restriction endonuclease